jgi:hypothetical protein
VSLGGHNALRETATLEVVSFSFGNVKGAYAWRETATLEVVSQQLNIIPNETTSTEHERQAYAGNDDLQGART